MISKNKTLSALQVRFYHQGHPSVISGIKAVSGSLLSSVTAEGRHPDLWLPQTHCFTPCVHTSDKGWGTGWERWSHMWNGLALQAQVQPIWAHSALP